MLLCEVPHIRLNAEIEFNKKITENDLNNYFRIFKPQDETLEYDCIYSPFFDTDTPYVLGDDYASRMALFNILCEKLPEKAITLYVSYDFSYAPVNLRYTTDGEFGYIGDILKQILPSTNLSLLMLVSHFNQFANKAGTALKPEHYHILLDGKSEADMDFGINQLVYELKKKQIFKKITLKGI